MVGFIRWNGYTIASLINRAFRFDSATSMNQPRRPRLIAIALLAILAAALVVFPAYSAPTQKAEKFIEIAQQAKGIAEQLRAIAQSRGLDTQQADTLILQGNNLLGEARTAQSAGNSELAFSRARQAQSAFRDAIALLSAPSVVMEEAEEARGLLVAAERARERIADLRLALTTYQTQISVDQQSVENFALVNSNLTSAEESLTDVENALKTSPPNISSAAQSLGEAQRSIRLAFAAMPRIESQTNAWRIPGFITAMENLIQNIDAQVKATGTQDLQARMQTVRALVDSAKEKAAQGDLQGALALVKDARTILHSIEKDLRGRGT